MQKLIDYPIALLRLIVAMTSMALFLLFYFLTSLFVTNNNVRGLRIQRSYARWALKVFSTKYTIVGKPTTIPALYVSNHRSLLDPVIIRAQVDALPVSKAEVSSYPILGSALRATGVIFVERTNTSSRQQAKNAIVKELESGNSVLLFPEGTVSDEPTTLPFRKGSFEKAVQAGVPVVPISIVYNDKKYHWYNQPTLSYFFNSFGWHTPQVTIYFDAPIQLNNPTELLNKVRDLINKNLIKHQY